MESISPLYQIYPSMKWIAHRGAARGNLELENTMVAFQRCVVKVDGIELDAHLTSDRKVIVTHDAELGGIPISSLTWDNIHSEYPLIPQLSEVVEWLQSNALLLYLEIKPGYSGIIAPILQLITPIRDRVTIISFSRTYLDEISKWDPLIKLGYLVENYNLLTSDLPSNWMIGISHNLLDEIDRSLYSLINVWTVNSSKILQRCKELEVNSITSDFLPSDLNI